MTRVLLDEGTPRPLARLLVSHGIDATAFPNEWKQLSNGALLERIEREGFDVLITCDKNMSAQQSLAGRDLAVLVLPTNRLKDVLESGTRIMMALSQLRPQQVAELSQAGQLTFRTA